MNTPDLPSNWKKNPYALYDRESFRVGERVFRRTEPGAYTDGAITVFCDQDSTSWMARVGALQTAWYWTPEFAVENLLDSVGKAWAIS